MDLALDILSWLLIAGGSIFLIIGGIGILRMPDVFTRMHAAGIPDTMGAGLLLAGMALQVEPGIVTIKLVLIMLFLLFTGPTATHAIANTLHSANLDMVIKHRDENENGESEQS